MILLVNIDVTYASSIEQQQQTIEQVFIDLFYLKFFSIKFL